jgi:hypothetical protein
MILAYSLIIGCSLMHILCCGIPLLATIIGFGAIFGFAAGSIAEHPLLEVFEKFEIEIMLLSGITLLLAFILKFRADKMSCCEKEESNFCAKNEKINNFFLKISSAFYSFTLFNFITSKLIN